MKLRRQPRRNQTEVLVIWDELTLEEESFEQVLDRRRRKPGDCESQESGLIEEDSNREMDLDGMSNHPSMRRAFREQVGVNQARKGSGHLRMVVT
jgi:hypothetical protein